MSRKSFAVVATVLVAGALAVGVVAADHGHASQPRVTPLASHDLAEKLDGKESKATAVEVTLTAGQAGDPHRHLGPGFGYVSKANTNGRSTTARPSSSNAAKPSTNPRAASTGCRRTSAERRRAFSPGSSIP